jgi:hypothetical protein
MEPPAVSASCSFPPRTSISVAISPCRPLSPSCLHANTIWPLHVPNICGNTPPHPVCALLLVSALDRRSFTIMPRPRQSKAGDSHLSRKREKDRLAQRASRERVKNHVLLLEEKVKALEANDKSEQITKMMNIIENLTDENSRLRSLLGKIRCLTTDVESGSYSKCKMVCMD